MALSFDVVFGRPQICNVPGHLFLFFSKLLYATPYDREIARHRLKLVHQLRRHCGHGRHRCWVVFRR